MGGLAGVWTATPRRVAGVLLVLPILVFPSHALALGAGPSVAGHGSVAQASPPTPQTRAPAGRVNPPMSKPAGRAGVPAQPAPPAPQTPANSVQTPANAPAKGGVPLQPSNAPTAQSPAKLLQPPP